MAEGRVEKVFVPVRDGARLATTLYLPAGDEPAPCVLEALPYRKDDLTATYRPEYRRLRDEHALAVARVDVRGTGSSDGLATDEYPAQEQQDLCDVIAWLADAAVVHRRGRHVRHVLLRLQRAAPRGRAAAGAQGGLRHLLQRRPLHRRRALHGRVAAAGWTWSTTRRTWWR